MGFLLSAQHQKIAVPPPMRMRTATPRNIQLLFEEEETLEVGEEGEEVGDSLASDVAEAAALVLPLTVTFRVT